MRNFRRAMVGVLVATTLLAPAFSSAITADELRSQINTLLAQIVILQQKIVANAATTVAPTVTTNTNTSTSAGVVCPVFNLTLSHGSRGEAVTALQRFLATKGFLTADAATGFYGDLTESAVRNFQAQQGIVSSGSAATTGWGSVGKQTSAAIVQACSTQATTPATPPSCSYNPIPTTSCNGTWTPSFNSSNCLTEWKCTAPTTLTACPAITRAACPVGQHYQYGSMRYDANGCGIQDATCVSDNVVLQSCPVYQRALCPTGQHYLYGASTFDQNGCEIPTAKCVADTNSSCQVSVIQVDCIQGAHYTGTTYTTDSNGCQVPHAGQCVADTSSSGGLIIGESDVHNPVTIQGPQTLIDAFNSCVYSFGWQGWSGNGISIDWGDGATAPHTPYSSANAGTSCTAEKTHLYSTPGTYTVRASLWHPGPTDAPITDWQGTATVLIHAGIGSATNNSANYANALTALESILNKILGR